jgi:ElaB/YqjD/DUF883 family membrane-anchored ribosome-binding protein
MLGQSTYSRAVSANVADIERRLRSLEQSLESAGRSTASSVASTADDLRDSIVSGLSGLVDRFRNSSLNAEASRMGDTAARVGSDALRRVSDEVQHRPLVILAVAVGIGFLIGAAGGYAGASERGESPRRARRRRR